MTVNHPICYLDKNRERKAKFQGVEVVPAETINCSCFVLPRFQQESLISDASWCFVEWRAYIVTRHAQTRT